MSNLVKELKSTVADLDSFAGYVSETEGEEDRSGIDNLVKYKEPKWFHNGVELPPDDEYIVTGTGRFVIKWHPDKSLAPDRIPVPDGEKFPDLKKRNEETPCEELVFDVDGKTKKGPWAPEHQVYLLNRAYDEFTYVTSTKGGKVAVDRLVKKVKAVRAAHNDNSLHVVVKLSNTFMSTTFGGQQRPDFVFQRAIPFGVVGGAPAPAQLPNPVIASLDQFTAEGQTTKKPTAKEVTGDEILY